MRRFFITGSDARNVLEDSALWDFSFTGTAPRVRNGFGTYRRNLWRELGCDRLENIPPMREVRKARMG